MARTACNSLNPHIAAASADGNAIVSGHDGAGGLQLNAICVGTGAGGSYLHIFAMVDCQVHRLAVDGR